jgi:hypothetical protein
MFHIENQYKKTNPVSENKLLAGYFYCFFAGGSGLAFAKNVCCGSFTVLHGRNAVRYKNRTE